MADKGKTTRREFLRGGRSEDSATDAGHECASADAADARAGGDASRSGERSYLIQVGRRAMACEFQVFLNAGQYPNGADLAVSALDLIDMLEAQLTVYRDDSEISRINRMAVDQPVALEPRLFALLKQAIQLSEQTAGAFDVTTGALSKLWGFFQRQGQFPSELELAEALKKVGHEHLHLDREQHAVRLGGAGVEINLGSIGKGYALDRCAELLVNDGIDDFLIHGGKSSMLARGDRWSGGAQPDGWKVSLGHPLRQEHCLGEIHLRDRALATSGSGNQFFHHQGKRYGHVLDPRTGRPADHVLSATVLAPTAALADALATALFVMDNEAAREFCAAHPDVSAILVLPGQRSGAFEIETIGLAAGDWHPS